MMALPTAPVGAKVLSADGKELGTLKEARDGCFKVDVRMAPDYWLDANSIENTDKGLVQLAITKEGISDAKVRMPDIADLHPNS